MGSGASMSARDAWIGRIGLIGAVGVVGAIPRWRSATTSWQVVDESSVWCPRFAAAMILSGSAFRPSAKIRSLEHGAKIRHQSMTTFSWAAKPTSAGVSRSWAA